MNNAIKSLFTLAFALVFMTGAAFAQTSTSSINQIGVGNASDVFQEGNLHQSTIDQDQGFNDGHEALLSQLGGDENFSDILQNQTSANASVAQTGSFNESRTKQSGFNDAGVIQTGENNKVGSYSDIDGGRAFQKNGTGSFASGYNLLGIEQVGNGNRTGINQEANTSSLVGLFGNSNEAKVSQKGENGGLLTSSLVEMTGNSNLVDVLQGGSGIGGNISSVLGTGNFNNVEVDQLTPDNTSSITIDGESNQSKVVQQ